MMLDVVANSMPMVRERKLKALALVGARRRLAQLPDVPTLTELGMPDLDAPGWTGVVVRRGTPQPVVDRLHAAVVQAVQSPEVAQRYGDLGLTVAPSSQAEFAELIRSETARWGQVIREAHVTLD
jgi:tripartite-type tricarboxylate transporter receptor subunit TctC